MRFYLYTLYILIVQKKAIYLLDYLFELIIFNDNRLISQIGK